MQAGTCSSQRPSRGGQRCPASMPASRCPPQPPPRARLPSACSPSPLLYRSHPSCLPSPRWSLLETWRKFSTMRQLAISRPRCKIWACLLPLPPPLPPLLLQPLLPILSACCCCPLLLLLLLLALLALPLPTALQPGAPATAAAAVAAAAPPPPPPHRRRRPGPSSRRPSTLPLTGRSSMESWRQHSWLPYSPGGWR